MSHYHCVELAEKAYHYHTFSVNEIEFIVQWDIDGTLFVVFRGTEVNGYESHTTWQKIKDAWDIVRDLRIYPWPVIIEGTEYRGHAGFIRGSKVVVNMLSEFIKEGDFKRLVVIGHSLGGAIALPVGLQMAYMFRSVEIVTFGAPKVFCRQIEIPPNTTITMYRNGRDLITYVPIGKHPVKPIRIGEAKHWHASVADHPVKLYKEAMKREQK